MSSRNLIHFFKRSRTVVALTAAGAMAMFSSAAAADFPTGTITYLNPFSPGGECDIVQRMQQNPMQELMDVDVVIEYREGGGGAVGWSHVSRQPADGYTFACFSIPHIIAQPMTRAPGYQTDDLHVLYTYHSTPQVLVVRNDSPFETLEDFITAAQEAPGSITVGGTGTASGNHLATVRLMRAADITVTWIPFPGSGPTIPALEGGHVSALMTNSTMAVQNSDKFRALAVATEESSDLFPGVPTFREHGYDVVEAIYRGALGPRGIPEENIARIVETLDTINRDQAERKAEMGFQPVFYGPEESAELIERLKLDYHELLEELGMLN